MSSRGAEPATVRPTEGGCDQAGFMLVEVLVAVVVAGLVLGAVGAALAQGWRNTRIPLDVLSAAMLARSALDRVPADTNAAGVPAGFSLSRRVRGATLEVRASPVAPAPRPTPVPGAGSTGAVPRANDVMPGVTHHPERGASGRLDVVTVTVRTPTGRRITLEAVRLDAAQN